MVTPNGSTLLNAVKPNGLISQKDTWSLYPEGPIIDIVKATEVPVVQGTPQLRFTEISDSQAPAAPYNMHDQKHALHS
ncbi:hypothetical protein Bca4012_065161 [Brassica carinata]|uniref:Uncharacterized protein n=1 Tax=Brassica carinata TaxID=52824 RepID=A0A8X8AXI8_BRACI|nr:hypothetical protein Bca52824_017589 [Brassica carinata]